YRYPLIAREGRPFIGLALGGALLLHYYLGGVFALPLWLLVLAGLYLFRDPPRKVPASPLGVISPVDGRVESLATVTDPWLERRCLRLEFRMNPTGVFSLRAPVEGKVVRQWYPGEDRDAPYVQWLQTDEGEDVILTIGHRARRRAVCYVSPGQRVGQGQRCGYVPFGTRVQILLPANSRSQVEPGRYVRSGTDIIANVVRG
ncbi:MAG TPA: phosphatidylserine decarboxylase, partial [Gammaproteobacteria bacterium]|nr:phosphatidylserine decarboxylase [Gammaproteobacteria bacterium]